MNGTHETVVLTYHFPFNLSRNNVNANLMFAEAQTIANYAVENKHRRKTLSTSEIKRVFVPSAIANQILRKYSNKTIKVANNVHLIIPNQSIKYDGENIRVKCLDLTIPWKSGKIITKINQIEIHKDHIYICVSVKIPNIVESINVIGVDLNTTHHMAVVSDIQSGKIWKLDKQIMNMRKGYQTKRQKAQKCSNWRVLKDMRKREQNIARDNNHKLVNKIIDIAEETKSSIAIEDLTNIRINTVHKSNKKTRRATNSWSFSQFRFFLEYKCKLRGINLHVVEPAYTSQMCSKCIHIGQRDKKMFHCHVCGHHDHADVNAGFNIARRAITTSNH